MKTATLVLGVATLFAAVARAGHSPLDGTFDGDGAVLTPLDAIWATAIQPGGRILAAGSAGGDFAVARYEADGTPDNTFDGDGLATSAASPAFEGVAFDVAVQADGKIVVAGATGSPINFNFGLVRFEANGALDGTFGSGSVAVVDVGANDDHERRADGAQRVFLRGGPTRSLVTLLGRNRPAQNQWDLPTGIPQRLLGSPSVTMQFVPSDTGGCFSKQLTQILVSSPTKFRAN